MGKNMETTILGYIFRLQEESALFVVCRIGFSRESGHGLSGVF